MLSKGGRLTDILCRQPTMEMPASLSLSWPGIAPHLARRKAPARRGLSLYELIIQKSIYEQ